MIVDKWIKTQEALNLLAKIFYKEGCKKCTVENLATGESRTANTPVELALNFQWCPERLINVYVCRTWLCKRKIELLIVDYEL